jgi:hypothetical protein
VHGGGRWRRHWPAWWNGGAVSAAVCGAREPAAAWIWWLSCLRRSTGRVDWRPHVEKRTSPGPPCVRRSALGLRRNPTVLLKQPAGSVLGVVSVDQE